MIFYWNNTIYKIILPGVNISEKYFKLLIIFICKVILILYTLSNDKIRFNPGPTNGSKRGCG